MRVIDNKWSRIKRRCCVPSVDGLWMDWEAWSQCTVSCGGGNRTRTRQCYHAKNGGKPCEGKDFETEACETQTCPGTHDIQ